MDFSFPKEYQLFRRMVRQFCENEVQPLARAIDREHRVPHETLRKSVFADTRAIRAVSRLG